MSMIVDFTGKTVLVTGGGRGLGKDMALLFAECGADVMIAGRGISHLEKTVSEIRSTGAGGEYCVCDVSRSDDVEALVKAAAAFGKGKLDIVVHAAGVQSIDDLLLTTDEEIAKVMAVNVGGTANIIKHALPVLPCELDLLCFQGCGDQPDPERIQDGCPLRSPRERDPAGDYLYGYVGRYSGRACAQRRSG